MNTQTSQQTFQQDESTFEDLVTRAREGQSEAWAELMSRFDSLIRSTTRKYRLNAHDAEDVAQTVWMRLFEHLDRIQEPRALPGWVAVTVARECGHALTKARRTVTVDPTDLFDYYRTDPHGGDEPGEEIMREETRETVREAVQELPERSQRLLVLLTQDPAPSYAEISDELHMPVGSIGPTRARCLQRLSQVPVMQPLLDLAG